MELRAAIQESPEWLLQAVSSGSGNTIVVNNSPAGVPPLVVTKPQPQGE